MRSPVTALGIIALTAPLSHAAIVYTDIIDTTVPYDSGLFLAVDLNGDAISPTFLTDGSSSFDLYELVIENAAGYVEFTLPEGATYGPEGLVDRLAANTWIPAYVDSEASWVGGNTYIAFEGQGSWEGTSGIAYAGVTFTQGSDLHTGWVRLSYDDATNSLTVLDFAYETTPDTGIFIGAIPEPSTSLLAVLSGSLLCARRKR